VGEGPGATMKQLTELQKDLGHQRASTNLDQKTSVGPPAHSSTVHPPAEIAPPKATVFPDVPSVKPSEPSTRSTKASSSGAATSNIPVADAKPMSDTKKGKSVIPPPAPSKSVPPSGIPDPPEKEVSRQTSAGKMPTAAPLPSSTAGKAASSADSQYRIGPEDVLHVSVWGNEQLTMDVIVRPDGKISIPLIQDIQAEGFTASEMADRIHEKLLPYIKDPNVSVIVMQINAPKFSVIGYVNRPGTYPMRGDVTVLQALSEAGGFTPFASPKKIKLVRNAGGKQEIRKFNYYDMIDKGGEGNFLLKPGDTIVVP